MLGNPNPGKVGTPGKLSGPAMQSIASIYAPRPQIGKLSQGGTVANAYWQLDKNGTALVAGQPTSASFSFGSTEDRFFAGDWSGTGTAKPAVYTTSGIWYLDSNGDNVYDTQINMGGGATSIPIIGDWNGDGRTKVGIFDSSTQTWTLDLAGNGSGFTSFVFGQQDPSSLLVPVVYPALTFAVSQVTIVEQ